MRSAAMPSRQVSSTAKNAKNKNQFKVCIGEFNDFDILCAFTGQSGPSTDRARLN